MPNADLALLQHIIRGLDPRLTRLQGFLRRPRWRDWQSPTAKDSTLQCSELPTPTVVVLDSACGPAVVASGLNFHAANKPPTRSAAATASGMIRRLAGLSPVVLVPHCPQETPQGPNLLEDARWGELPTVLRDTQRRQRISPWSTANQAPESLPQRRQPSASCASSAESESPRSRA